MTKFSIKAKTFPIMDASVALMQQFILKKIKILKKCGTGNRRSGTTHLKMSLINGFSKRGRPPCRTNSKVLRIIPKGNEALLTMWKASHSYKLNRGFRELGT